MPDPLASSSTDRYISSHHDQTKNLEINPSDEKPVGQTHQINLDQSLANRIYPGRSTAKSAKFLLPQLKPATVMAPDKPAWADGNKVRFNMQPQIFETPIEDGNKLQKKIKKVPVAKGFKKAITNKLKKKKVLTKPWQRQLNKLRMTH